MKQSIPKLLERIRELTDALWRLRDWYDSRSESFRKRANQLLWHETLLVLHRECNHCGFMGVSRRAKEEGKVVSICWKPEPLDAGKQWWTVYVHPKRVKRPQRYGDKYFALSCPQKPMRCECDWMQEVK